MITAQLFPCLTRFLLKNDSRMMVDQGVFTIAVGGRQVKCPIVSWHIETAKGVVPAPVLKTEVPHGYRGFEFSLSASDSR